MEDKAYYQVQGRIDRKAVQEKYRQLEILRASFVHLNLPLPPDRFFPSDFPSHYIEAVCLAMVRYQKDDKPRLIQQLADQERFIADLESRKAYYAEWRFNDLMNESVRILNRIKHDLSIFDKFE